MVSRRFLPLVLLPALLAGARPAAGQLLMPRADLLPAISFALADSMGRRLVSTRATVLEAGPDGLVLDTGSAAGLRDWSLVGLVTPWGTWSGTVRRLEENRVSLQGVPDQEAPRPAAGTRVGVRLDVRRLALVPFQPGDRVTPAAALNLTRTLARALGDKLGVIVEEAPFLPDTAEVRTVAAEGGADILLSGEVALQKTDLRVVLRLTRARRPRGVETISMLWPDGAAEFEGVAGSLCALPSAPPGVRAAPTREAPGPLLAIFPCRFRARSLYAVFLDRIETWSIAGDSLQTVMTRNLSGMWPVDVPSRWPVAGVAVIDRYFDMATRKESRVFYALCSNQRARYVNVAEDITAPDSLYLAVSAGPSDTLAASFASCFPRVSLVDPPKGYPVPRGLPPTATSRLALSRALVGPSGQPSLDEQGAPRTERMAVIYYDQPSASLWISTADSAWQVPGLFGNAMDTWRYGTSGPPGFLVTSALSPGEGDRLEYWALRDGALRREWETPIVPGSITALASGDLDGDGRDDLVIGEVLQGPEGFTTQVHLMRSRMRGVQP